MVSVGHEPDQQARQVADHDVDDQAAVEGREIVFLRAHGVACGLVQELDRHLHQADDAFLRLQRVCLADFMSHDGTEDRDRDRDAQGIPQRIRENELQAEDIEDFDHMYVKVHLFSIEQQYRQKITSCLLIIEQRDLVFHDLAGCFLFLYKGFFFRHLFYSLL